MFQHRYIIKVYYEGKHTPELEFAVNAQYIKIEEHSVRIDGVTLYFSDKHYIASEMA